MTGGHLFIVAGDITHLHCDAWLLPTDDHFATVGDFTRVVEEVGWSRQSVRWSGPDELFRRLLEPAAVEPQIWLGRIGSVDKEPEWYADRAARFIAQAAEPARVRGLTERPVPLLALPVLGTRAGGGRWEEKGEILKALVGCLTQAATEHNVDIAIVTWGQDRREAHAMYSAAQRARRRWSDSAPSFNSWELGPRSAALESAATSLAEQARSGRLVLFLGAGVSAGAGLPTWQGLIDRLAAEAGLDAESLLRLRRMDLRDQATIVMRGFPNSRSEIAAALATPRYPLTGALLASLPTREAITTNYDELFEAAVEARKEELVVLPYSAVTEPDQRWLLKLHGTIAADGDDIVLTRDDYLGAPSRNAALFGLVQAMLLTRHLLFVGYSLSDEDFHKIVHEVRSAQTAAGKGDVPTLGSALVLDEDPLHEMLWKGTIDVVAAEPTGSSNGTAEAARTLQVFLDRVAYLAADMSAFILSEEFACLLDAGEKQIAEALRTMATAATTDPQLSAKVDAILRSFGGTAIDTRA